MAKSKKGRAVKSAKKPKYLSAKALEITEAEKRWLIETATQLKAHKATLASDDLAPINGFDLGFDMTCVADPADDHFCGAVGCIKGWMGLLAFNAGKGPELGLPKKIRYSDLLREVETMEHSDILDELFYPTSVSHSTVTAEVAAKAIESFLATKDPQFQKCGAESYYG